MSTPWCLRPRCLFGHPANIKRNNAYFRNRVRRQNLRNPPTFAIVPFTHSVSCWISSNPRPAICCSSSSPYKCGTHVLMKRYSSSVRFFGTLNQNSGRNLFLPYDITEVGNGIVLPIGRPMRNRKYSGGSGQARAGRGISSVWILVVFWWFGVEHTNESGLDKDKTRIVGEQFTIISTWYKKPIKCPVYGREIYIVIWYIAHLFI